MGVNLNYCWCLILSHSSILWIKWTDCEPSVTLDIQVARFESSKIDSCLMLLKQKRCRIGVSLEKFINMQSTFPWTFSCDGLMSWVLDINHWFALIIITSMKLFTTCLMKCTNQSQMNLSLILDHFERIPTCFTCRNFSLVVKREFCHFLLLVSMNPNNFSLYLFVLFVYSSKGVVVLDKIMA